MTKTIAALIIVLFTASSCDEILSRPGDDFSSLAGTGDHGGNSGSGGGTNISFTSVPAPVKASFSSQFPAANNAEWKKLNNGNYKAQFYNGGIRWEVTYAASGIQLKLERA